MASTPAKPEERDEKLEVSIITEYLLLSGCIGLNENRFKQLGITCAINCVKGIKHSFPSSIEYHYIPVDDEESEHLLPYFDHVLNTIERHRKIGGKTLVYCGLGISRSASFVIAYMMLYQNQNLHDAYKTVQSRRSIICPNVGFFRQLLELEQRLYGKQTVKIIEPAPGVKVADVIWAEIYDEVMQKLEKERKLAQPII